MSTRPKKLITERRDSDALVLKNKEPKGATSLTLTSVAVAREVSRQLDTRREQRKAVWAPTQVRFRGRYREVQLINLSSGGAMIEGSLSSNIAETALLNLNGDMPECVVRWVKGKRAGLEFAVQARVKGTSGELEGTPPKETAQSRSTVHMFLNSSGEPIGGSHRWTARLRKVAPTADLLATSSKQFQLASEAMRDFSSSGTIRATISWSGGGRVRRMH